MSVRIDVRFWAWAAWKDAGKPAGERPPQVPKRIPASWWPRYAIHRGGLHPKPKPVIPPAIVPHVGLETLIQRVVYAAEQPLTAIGLPVGSGVALTCDPNPSYAAYATASTVAALRSAGLWVTCWGNQSQIGAERIRQVHHDLSLDGEPIFQFETADECDSMLGAYARLGVGNGNALRPEQVTALNRMIDAGTFACSQESYRNVTGGPWPDQTSAAGLKVCSLTLGNYDGSAENPGIGSYVSLEEYQAHSTAALWRNVCSYHARGNRGSWAAFPH